MLRSWSNTVLHKMPFYAVHVGKKPGIYDSWNEAKTHCLNFPGAVFKKFSTRSEAEIFKKFGHQANKSIVNELLNSDFPNNNQNNNASTSNSKQIFKIKAKPIQKPHALKPYERKNRTTKKTILLKQEDLPQNKEGDTQFNSNKDCYVVYTDGACPNNGKRGARAGYGVWWGKDNPLNTCGRMEGIQTNQRAEIKAIGVAIKQAIEHKYNNLSIITDSMFAINCLTKWFQSWRKNNWIKSDGKPVIHKIQLIEILDDMQKIKVKFEHVRGHSGNHGNEMADQLAVQGSQMT